MNRSFIVQLQEFFLLPDALISVVQLGLKLSDLCGRCLAG